MSADLSSLEWDAPAAAGDALDELDWGPTEDQPKPRRAVETPARHRNLDSGQASEALARARRERGEALLAVSQGRLTPEDVISRAVSSGPRNPLLKLTLTQLLLAQPRVTPKQVRPIIDHLSEVLSEPAESMTLAWLVDRRAHGRRYQAWVDVQKPKEALWPGFPWKAESHVG